VTISLQETQAVSQIAHHLYDYLPGNAYPFADQDISFAGVAQAIGLHSFWQAGSKLPAITKLLQQVLDGQRSSFCKLILEIVHRGIGYRNNKGNPITQEEIQELNELITAVNFKIPELWDAKFLDSLPRRQESPPLSAEVVDDKLVADLKQRLLELQKVEPNPRGYAFEKFLQDLFEVFNLNPRRPFRFTGEQIDGSFDLDGETYLVEARWHNKPSDQGQLLVFSGKVGGKATWARGLFISYSGFTQDGLDAYSKKGATSIVGMTGEDLWFILDGKMTLPEAIRLKARRAAETGQFYLKVSEVANLDASKESC